MKKEAIGKIIVSYFFISMALGISVGYNTKLPMDAINLGSIVGSLFFIISITMFFYTIKNEPN